MGGEPRFMGEFHRIRPAIAHLRSQTIQGFSCQLFALAFIFATNRLRRIISTPRHSRMDS